LPFAVGPLVDTEGLQSMTDWNSTDDDGRRWLGPPALNAALTKGQTWFNGPKQRLNEASV
jgi:hypothetical protein